jgi:DNA-binding MurR/RpiR family transcriptional regulator
MDGNQSLSTMLQKKLKELTSREELLASDLSNNAERWAFDKASSIAEQTGVHRSTVIRFAQKMGFRGFPELQSFVREEYLKQHGSSPELHLDLNSSDNGEISSIVRAVYNKDLDNLNSTYRNLDLFTLEQTAKGLVNARRILIFGRRFSYPIALHVGYFLRVMRSGIHIGPDPGGTVVESLYGMDSSDYAFIVTLARRSPEVQKVLSSLEQAKVPMTVLTDAQNLSKGPDNALYLTARLGSTSILGSYASLLSICHALLYSVGTKIPEAQGRFKDIERAYADFNQL